MGSVNEVPPSPVGNNSSNLHPQSVITSHQDDVLRIDVSSSIGTFASIDTPRINIPAGPATSNRTPHVRSIEPLYMGLGTFLT